MKRVAGSKMLRQFSAWARSVSRSEVAHRAASEEHQELNPSMVRVPEREIGEVTQARRHRVSRRADLVNGAVVPDVRAGCVVEHVRMVLRVVQRGVEASLVERGTAGD